MSGGKILEVLIQIHSRTGSGLEVPVFSVPRHIALEKLHAMPPAFQLADQGPKGGGVAIPPRGRDGKSDDHNVHGYRAASVWDRVSISDSS